jgi:tetratricopeptide (TPR) repeat protein
MKKIIAIFSIVLLSMGCNELLNVEVTSYITNDSYWQGEGDVTGYMNGIYVDLRDQMNATYGHREERSDAFVAGLEGSVSNAWAQNLTDANAPSWGSYYTLNHHCNLVIKYGPAIEPNTAAVKRAVASAYVLRAYNYFMLIRIWGDVPIVLEPTESNSVPLSSRVPAADVMTQILGDIEEAIKLFPENGYVDKNTVSKPVAYALKADALLWKNKVLGGANQDLLDAIDAADQVLASGVDLLPDFADVFSVDNKKNKEIIFALYFGRDEKSDHYGSRLKPRDIFVNTAQNKNDLAYAVQTRARSVYAPSDAIKNIYTSANDVRKTSVLTAVDLSNNVIGVFDNKFRGKDYDGKGDRYYEDDLIVYRAAEMILFKAEAFAALGNIPEAIVELQKIRDRAHSGTYSGPMDKQSVEREILDERFREFWLEQRRWPDLVRFHYGNTINVYNEVPNLVGKTVPLFYPILQTEINLNPNLDQTTGYKF